MTTPQNPQPYGQQPSGPPGPMQQGPSPDWKPWKPAVKFNSHWVWAGGLVVAFFLGMAAGGGGKESADASPQNLKAESTTSSSAAPAWKPTTTTKPPAVMPAPADFTVAVSVLEKKCFGSAGCNVTYQIEPAYVGAADLPTGKDITVVYEIQGGEEPQTGRFTLRDGQARFDSEESIQTSSSSSVLTAVVTQVL